MGDTSHTRYISHTHTETVQAWCVCMGQATDMPTVHFSHCWQMQQRIQSSSFCRWTVHCVTSKKETITGSQDRAEGKSKQSNYSPHSHLLTVEDEAVSLSTLTCSRLDVLPFATSQTVMHSCATDQMQPVKQPVEWMMTVGISALVDKTHGKTEHATDIYWGITSLSPISSSL